MINPVCLKLKDYEDRYICNEKYINVIRKDINTHTGSYEVIINNVIQNMKDLIHYGLTYNYDIEIPDNYKVTKYYHIVFSTSNFEPKNREHTFVKSSITFTTTTKSQVKKMFDRMCKTIGRKPIYQDRFTFCWQTDDFAVNQIVNSYSITESYLVEEIDSNIKEDYKDKVIDLIQDIHGFCRNDVLNDLIKQIRSL